VTQDGQCVNTLGACVQMCVSVIRYRPVSSNAQDLTNSVSKFVMLATYPAMSPCTAIPGTWRWCCSRRARDREESNSRQRAQQITRAKMEYFNLQLFCFNMTQLFTAISGSLCSSVRIGTRLRVGRPRDRCSIPGSNRLVHSNPKSPDLIQGRPNFLFNGNQEIFRWERGVKRSLAKPTTKLSRFLRLRMHGVVNPHAYKIFFQLFLTKGHTRYYAILRGSHVEKSQ